MKKYLISLILAIVTAAVIFGLCGCLKIDYGNFHLLSFGGTQVDGLEAVKDGNDILVEVKTYRKESVGDVAGKVAEGVARGMK